MSNNSEIIYYCVLTWGYSVFHHQVEERKQSYVDSYDIVLINDETMEVPNAILLYLTGNKWTESWRRWPLW